MATFIDFFAGSGGFRRGMELAEHKALGFCEFDKYAVMSYKSMHCATHKQRKFLKTLPTLTQRRRQIKRKEYLNGEWYANDIKNVRSKDIPYADIWCAGFPCQDISIAGKKTGLDGNRSNLYFTLIDLIKGKAEKDKPRYILLENVKNLLSINGGWDFARVLIALDEAGYDADWQVINSKDFGVPQNRERVFIVGYLRGQCPGTILPVSGAAGENCISLVGHREGYRRNSQTYTPEGITEALDTGQGEGRNFNVIVKGRLNTSQDGKVFSADGISQCLSAGHNNQPKVFLPSFIDMNVNAGIKLTNHARCLQARHGVLIDDFCIRKLTPLECSRLQGWEDKYFYRAQLVNSDSQLYKQYGNGVTVSVVRAIAQKIK